MNGTNIFNFSHAVKEDSKPMQERFAFTKLIQSLIHEYGEYHNNSICVDVMYLSISDKRLVLSYVVDSEELEWAYESPSKTENLFKEHLNFIQRLFDNEASEVYVEAMEERDMKQGRYSDNGETYWYRD